AYLRLQFLLPSVEDFLGVRLGLKDSGHERRLETAHDGGRRLELDELPVRRGEIPADLSLIPPAAAAGGPALLGELCDQRRIGDVEQPQQCRQGGVRDLDIA